jgi:hypothetical protein
MKILIITLLLIPFTGQTQSKKELRAEVSKYLVLSASLESDLRKQTAVSDSLRIRTIRLEEQILILEKSMKEYRNSITEYTEEISRLEEELDNCMSKGKPVTPPKTKKPESNPFGGTGGGGGRLGNDNQPFGDGNGDGKGWGKGSGDTGRTRISNPDFSTISSNETCYIHYTIFVDDSGNVVGEPELNTEKTTTTDQELIKKVTEKVKSEVKYSPNKVITKKNSAHSLVIHINAN